MISKGQLDLFDPAGGRRGRCDGDFSQPFANTGARAYAHVGRFEKVPPCIAPSAPSAPCQEAVDPARNYPTKASLDAAWAEYNGRWEAWEAAGKIGEEPHPPAGMLSAMADRLIPRRALHQGKRWR